MATRPHPHLPADAKLLGLMMRVLTGLDRAADALRGLVSPSGLFGARLAGIEL